MANFENVTMKNINALTDMVSTKIADEQASYDAKLQKLNEEHEAFVKVNGEDLRQLKLLAEEVGSINAIEKVAKKAEEEMNEAVLNKDFTLIAKKAKEAQKANDTATKLWSQIPVAYDGTGILEKLDELAVKATAKVKAVVVKDAPKEKATRFVEEERKIVYSSNGITPLYKMPKSGRIPKDGDTIILHRTDGSTGSALVYLEGCGKISDFRVKLNKACYDKAKTLEVNKKYNISLTFQKNTDKIVPDGNDTVWVTDFIVKTNK